MTGSHYLDAIFYPSGRIRPQRRTVQTATGPRVEFGFPCPVLCHGFGRCRTCNDTGVTWRRPRPYAAWGF